MTQNSFLRVFVANGYYDLATPFAATQYTMDHLGERSLNDRITMAYYESGHMVYIDQPAAAKYHADLVKFVEGAVPQ